MREIKYRLRIGKEIIGYERWYKGDGSNAHWEHLKIGEIVWKPAFLYATEKDLYYGRDKKDKNIYEGDIIKMSSGNATRVYFNDGGFCADVGGVLIGFRPDYLGRYKNKAMEVIGNIYENPELLEDRNGSESLTLLSKKGEKI